MDKYELQKLLELPIEGVAERLGLTVKRHRCLCPFHDDHEPSLSFKVSKNTYRCYVCGASGGPIDLAMALLPYRGGREGSPFLEACHWLADEHNVIISDDRFKVNGEGFKVQEPKPFDASRYVWFFERPWLSGEAKKFLFEERRIDPRVVRWCRLTSWKDRQSVPWLQTPYYDREGKLIGVQNRNLVKGGTPRFRFPTGSQCNLYNLPVLNLLRPGEALYIAEGCSDCWSLLSAGHKAIAIPSATLLSKRDKELLQELATERSVRFHMWPDNDAPGERLFLQLQEVVPELVRHQLPPSCKDFSDYYLSVRTQP